MSMDNDTLESDFKQYYENCILCPRKCGVNRNKGERGFCQSTSELQIASAGLHFGEEPVITARGGSGTIFVSGCNLHCAFCQNYQISQQQMGRTVSTEEFAEICLRLQTAGAENINIVTGSHATPALAAGIIAAKKSGLSIPVCWNSSGYESVDVIKMLSNLVDIWLPDLKTLNTEISSAVFKTDDYPATAKKAIRQMISQTPRKIIKLKSAKKKPLFSKNSISSSSSSNTQPIDFIQNNEKMISGVIIRHLFLPGRMNDTIQTLNWLKEHTDKAAFSGNSEKSGNGACISVMTQYTPIPFEGSEQIKRSHALSAFQNRFVNNGEYNELTNKLIEYDFDYLFYQELSQDTEWLPDFNEQKPFPATISKPIWHWKTGFLE